MVGNCFKNLKIPDLKKFDSAIPCRGGSSILGKWGGGGGFSRCECLWRGGREGAARVNCETVDSEIRHFQCTSSILDLSRGGGGGGCATPSRVLWMRPCLVVPIPRDQSSTIANTKPRVFILFETFLSTILR